MSLMQSFRFCLLAIAVSCVSANMVLADLWSTRDGKISVDVPDPNRFEKHGNDEFPLWVALDGTTVIGVDQMPWHHQRELIASSVQKGFLREMSGTMVHADEVQVGGRRVLRMLCKFREDPAFDSYCYQWVVRVQNTTYKLMAIRRGIDPRNDPEVKSFFSSLHINVDLANDLPRAMDGARPVTPNAGADAKNPVETIAGVCFFGLLLFAVHAGFKRFRS